MKGTFLLSLALAAATVSAGYADSAAHSKKVLETEGLIGFWTFEDSFSDLTANANQAKAAGAGAAGTTFCPGANGGKGIRINNANDEGNFVEVATPIGSIFDTEKFSVVFWARNEIVREPTDTDQWNSLVDRNSLWYTSLNSVDQDGEFVSQYVVRLYSAENPTGGGTPQIGRTILPDEPVVIKVGEWRQYALTYDGEKVSAYLDGKLLLEYEYDLPVGPTADTPEEAPRGNYNLTWGGWQQRGDWFTGCFDDTAYFNRALTAEEVQGLFDAMKAAP